jgi:hypothetical protein
VVTGAGATEVEATKARAGFKAEGTGFELKKS